jgi:acetyl esterase/lipase
MKVPPMARSHEEFPASTVASEGIKSLWADEKGRSVETILGVEYAQKSALSLRLNILAPRLGEGESALFPLVMFVQGSAWRKQELTQELAQLVSFAATGLVIAMVEYRPSSIAPFPAQVKDARTATRFMLKEAERYHADPNRLVVWGDSSGGHTVTMLAVTEGDPEFSDEDPSEPPLGIRGVVDYYGPADLGTMNDEPSTQDHDSPDSPEGMVLGGVRVSDNPDRVRRASPLDYIVLSAPLPPFLIMHGDKDRLVPFGQSVMLYDKLKECARDVEMYRLEGADHGGNAFWTAAEPRAVTLAFIRSCCS